MFYLGCGFIIWGLFLLIFCYLIMPKNNNYPKKKKENNKYCILIPARNESKVIESLLVSIENQTKKVNKRDVYIIVEDPNDLTVSIAKKHHMNIVFRKDLSKKRKGYALDDAIKEILNDNKKYTAYFIIDADNILDKNFIKMMSYDIDNGYDIGIGYRNTKNGDNLVACSSALTFSLLNTLVNNRKSKYTNTLSISGTGFYIRGTIIEKLKGFPFNSLTEDYELTLYSTLNNLTTTYNERAICYDEQPDNFKTSIIQRTRWVKGYFEARGKYFKKIMKSLRRNDPNYASKIIELIGINPLIVLALGILLFLLNSLINHSFLNFLLVLLACLLIIYLILVFITIVLLQKEKQKLNIQVSKIKLILYNPLFLAGFVICLMKVIFNKNIEWQAIPHDKNLKL